MAPIDSSSSFDLFLRSQYNVIKCFPNKCQNRLPNVQRIFYNIYKMKNITLSYHSQCFVLTQDFMQNLSKMFFPNSSESHHCTHGPPT